MAEVKKFEAFTAGIGGAPLSGKSEIATYVLDTVRHALPKAPEYTGTDFNRRMQVALLKRFPMETAMQVAPGLMALPTTQQTLSVDERVAKMAADPTMGVRRQQLESQELWGLALNEGLAENYGRGLDTLVEGVAVRPEIWDERYGHDPLRPVVFVGNNTVTDEHIEGVIKAVRPLPKHWMSSWGEVDGSWTDEQIAKYMRAQVPAYSEAMQEGAEKYGYPYLDLSAPDAHGIYDHRARQQEAGAFLAHAILEAVHDR